MFAFYAGCRGFESHVRHMSYQFLQSNRPVLALPVFTVWWSVSAVSLNIGSGVHFQSRNTMHYACTWARKSQHTPCFSCVSYSRTAFLVKQARQDKQKDTNIRNSGRDIFSFQYLPEKKLKQKELEKKSKQ